jgi:hypothetical protein
LEDFVDQFLVPFFNFNIFVDINLDRFVCFFSVVLGPVNFIRLRWTDGAGDKERDGRRWREGEIEAAAMCCFREEEEVTLCSFRERACRIFSSKQLPIFDLLI